MASFHPDTSIRLDGPWIISKDQLEALDAVVATAYAKLSDAYEEELRKEIEARFQHLLERRRDARRMYRLAQSARSAMENAGVKNTDDSHAPSRESKKVRDRLRAEAEEYVRKMNARTRAVRNVSIGLPGGGTLQDKSFSDIARDAPSGSIMPKTLHVVVAAIGISCTLEIRESGTLYLRAHPEDNAIAADVLAEFREWVVEVEPTKWQRAWLQYKSLVWYAFVLMVALCAPFVIPTSARSPYVAEAHALLRKGVAPADEAKALELMLALSSGYMPPGFQQHVPSPHWKMALMTLVLAFAIACVLHKSPPMVAIGFGGGEREVQRLRRRMDVVSKVVPALVGVEILLPLVWQYILAWLNR